MAFNNYPQQQLPQGNQNTRKRSDKCSFSDGPLLDMSTEERHTGRPDFDRPHNRQFLTQTTYGYGFPRHPQSPTHPSFVNDGSNDHIPGPSHGMQRSQSDDVPYPPQTTTLDDSVRHGHPLTSRTHRYSRQVSLPPHISPAAGFDYPLPSPADPPAATMTQIPNPLDTAQYSYMMYNNRNTRAPLYQPSTPSGMVYPVYGPGFDDSVLAPTNNEELNYFHPSSPDGVVASPEHRHYHAGMWARPSIPNEQTINNIPGLEGLTTQSPIVDQLSPSSVINASPLPSSPTLSAPGGFPNVGAVWQTYPNHQGKSIYSYINTLGF
jgi:hypothetical protein